jgi:hypothetical protein
MANPRKRSLTLREREALPIANCRLPDCPTFARSLNQQSEAAISNWQSEIGNCLS